MIHSFRLLPLFLVTAGLAAGLNDASAGMISTVFDQNNGGARGGTIFFDLLVAGNDINVTGFDTNTAQLGALTGLEVYTRSGTAFGNELSPAGWTQVATGDGVGAGLDTPTAITLSNMIFLGAGTINGVALVMPATHSHLYTDDRSLQFVSEVSNADVTLMFGSATHGAFGAGAFSPRTWNGTLYYDLAGSPVPEPSSLALSVGFGLFGVWRYRKRRQLAQK